MIIGPAYGYWVPPLLYGIILIILTIRPRLSTLYFCFGASLSLNAVALINIGYFVRVSILLSFLLIIVHLTKYPIRKKTQFNLPLVGLVFACIISCVFFYVYPVYYQPQTTDWGIHYKMGQMSNINLRSGYHRTLVQSIQFTYLIIFALFIKNYLFHSKIIFSSFQAKAFE